MNLKTSMDLQTKYWHLMRFQMSRRLSKDEMIHLCTTLVMKHFKKGHEIGLEKECTNDVYFLKNGTVKIVNLDKSGKEIIKDIIKEGDIFGILGLLKGENKNDYAVAMEDSLICIIDTKTLKKMMNENENLNNYIFKLAGDRIQRLERKLVSLIYKDAIARIEEFIKDYVTQFGTETDGNLVAKNLINNKDIGKLTSTSRQTVNKVLNGLKAKEIIDFDRDTIKILKHNSA